jgi:hypothetical protein
MVARHRVHKYRLLKFIAMGLAGGIPIVGLFAGMIAANLCEHTWRMDMHDPAIWVGIIAASAATAGIIPLLAYALRQALIAGSDPNREMAQEARIKLGREMEVADTESVESKVHITFDSGASA